MQNIPVLDDPDGFVRADQYVRAIHTKTDNYTILSTELRDIFVATDAGDGVVFTLPPPTTRVNLTCAKGEGTTDLTLQAPAGVKINYGTAAKKYKSVTDADGVPVTVNLFSDGVDYFVSSQVGTWANDNA